MLLRSHSTNAWNLDLKLHCARSPTTIGCNDLEKNIRRVSRCEKVDEHLVGHVAVGCTQGYDGCNFIRLAKPSDRYFALDMTIASNVSLMVYLIGNR